MNVSSSKTIIYAIAALLVVLGGWVLIFYLKNGIESKLVYKKKDGSAVASQNSQEQKELKNNLLILDSDNDGLRDWEEKLLGTDALNPDSDGDGTLDKEEILKSRDPLKAGPDDQTANPSIKTSTSSNTTTKFIDDILTAYSTFNQKTLTDEQVRTIFTDKIIKNLEDATPLADTFSIEDINIIQDSENAMREYANSVGDIFNHEFRNTQKSEIVLLNEILSSQKFEDFRKFEQYELAYQSAVNALKALAVPSSYGAIHTGLLNNFQNLAYASAAFNEFKQDPIKAVLYIKYYKQEVERFKDIINTFALLLKKNGIMFGPSEGGSVILKYYNELQQTNGQ